MSIRKKLRAVWSGELFIFIVCLLVFPSASYAQTVPSGAEPGRLEKRFDQPTAPTTKPKIARGLESTTPPDEAASIQLKLTGIVVEGSTVYDQANLNAIYSGLVGKTVSLAQVFDIAAKITARYGQDGYLLSRAIVPPQALEPSGATIHIRVIEGYVDEVRWPETLGRYRNFFDAYASKVTTSRPLNSRTIERYLLLANKLPGLRFESNLVASKINPGASTLVVTVTEKPYDASISADNHGVESSGPYQATASGALNNRLGFHERLEATVTVAGLSEDDQKELGYVAWNYQHVLTAEGLTFFFNGNASHGDPGSATLLALDYETDGFNFSTGFSYPIILTRSEKLTGIIAFDFKNSESVSLGVQATEDRLRIIRGELAYEKADELNGVNQISIAAYKGIDGLGSTSNGNPVASRIPGVVDFFKVTGELSRTQQLKNNFSLYGSVFGQWTNDPLLSSQECGYGGRSYGRGFDASIVTGDQCFIATAELRHNLNLSGSTAEWLTYAQPYAFIDYGRIWNINAPLGTSAQDDGSSAGAGIRFGNDHFSADFTVTRVISTPDSQSSVDETRGWFKITFRL